MAEDTWLASGVGYAAPPARCARAVHRKGTTGGFKKGSRFGKLSETVHRQRTKTVLVNILYPTVALNELVLTKEGRKRYHTPHRCHAELAEALPHSPRSSRSQAEDPGHGPGSSARICCLDQRCTTRRSLRTWSPAVMFTRYIPAGMSTGRSSTVLSKPPATAMVALVARCPSMS